MTQNNSRLPPWDAFVTPVLTVLAPGDTLGLRELRDATAKLAHLSDEQRALTLPSGQSTADNRISWAVSYLTRVNAIQRPAKAAYRITPTGEQLLASHPDRAIREQDIRKLARNDDHWWEHTTAPRRSEKTAEPSQKSPIDNTATPEELITDSLRIIDDQIAAELLERLRAGTPRFFESTVVMSLLRAMGYGQADEAGTITSYGNDGGIDGIISMDALGLDVLFYQAKRYAADHTVERPEVQAFVGACSGKSERGVFLTTSRFSNGAKNYAAGVPSHIVLVDGMSVARLMIRYGVGVQTHTSVAIRRVDEDFFDEG